MEIELLVHVNNALDAPQRTNLEQQVVQTTGVAEARFCVDKNHLMFVKYNPAITRSIDLLRQVQQAGVSAQLVGL